MKFKEYLKGMFGLEYREAQLKNRELELEKSNARLLNLEEQTRLKRDRFEIELEKFRLNNDQVKLTEEYLMKEKKLKAEHSLALLEKDFEYKQKLLDETKKQCEEQVKLINETAEKMVKLYESKTDEAIKANQEQLKSMLTLMGSVGEQIAKVLSGVEINNSNTHHE